MTAAVSSLDDRPKTDPQATAARDVFMLGPEPTWQRCSCSALSARVPCFECSAEMDARADAAMRRRLADRTIPAEFAWAHIRAPELAKRIDARRRPLSDVIERILGAPRVVLAGGSGAGKTSLAVACLRERLHVGARFVSAIDLATARIQHAAGDGEASLVVVAIEAPLLLIDDLGEETMTSTSAVRDVVRARHAAGRATWVTTGLRSREIVAKYGDGIRRRLFEGAYAEWLGPMPKDVASAKT